MKINTRDFGQMEVSQEAILTFPAGVFAFEEAKRFALLSPLGDDTYPKWLQAVDDVSPCFIVFDPLLVDEGYAAKIEPFEERLLKLDGDSADKKNVGLLAIATVPEDYTLTTINMKAPIVVNFSDRIAAQVILAADYPFRFPLYSGEAKELKTGAGGQPC